MVIRVRSLRISDSDAGLGSLQVNPGIFFHPVPGVKAINGRTGYVISSDSQTQPRLLPSVRHDALELCCVHESERCEEEAMWIVQEFSGSHKSCLCFLSKWQQSSEI